MKYLGLILCTVFALLSPLAIYLTNSVAMAVLYYTIFLISVGGLIVLILSPGDENIDDWKGGKK